MAVKQTVDQRETSTTLESGCVRAYCVHGQNLPAWLYQRLQQAQQQSVDGRISAVLLLARGRQENLVVMSLYDFLRWSPRRTARAGRTEAASSRFRHQEG